MKYEFSQEVLGTRIRILFPHKKNKESVANAFAEAKRIEKKYSRFRPDSHLSQLNAHCGQWRKVDEEFFLLLKMAEHMQIESDGFLDISTENLLSSWGYDEEYSLTPKKKKGVKMGRVSFAKNNWVRLEAPIDLGSFGKGFALDRMASMMPDVSDVLIDAGGDLFGRGNDKTGAPFVVALENPLDTKKALGTITLNNDFLAASSPAQRSWGEFHHLINPHTKKPADEMAGVFVRSHSGLLADAWATALFTMGFSRARQCTQKRGISALLIAPDGKFYESLGFRASLFLTRSQ